MKLNVIRPSSGDSQVQINATRTEMILLALAGLSLVMSIVFAAMGDAWGWFLWWMLAIGFGVVWAIKEGQR